MPIPVAFTIAYLLLSLSMKLIISVWLLNDLTCCSQNIDKTALNDHLIMKLINRHISTHTTHEPVDTHIQVILLSATYVLILLGSNTVN